ncbi:MAG: MFS transporter [Sulfobacillus benefaciens]|uniref:MFS transporter n=1 Tax=Sulfobacillus benefaciens TaxID=453960 RepID=A0A2T2XCT5_9FIRM|nr:MAG: MFS transporter [Sulfobacillus benefaciens]
MPQRSLANMASLVWWVPATQLACLPMETNCLSMALKVLSQLMDKRHTLNILLALTSGMVLIPINSTMIAVGLLPIAHGVGVPLNAVVWVVTVYLVVMAALQPIAGKLGDLLGHRLLYLSGLSIFFVSSALAAVTPHLWAIIAFRSGQAIGGAFLTPNAMAIIRRSFEQNILRRVLSWVSLIQGLGAACGPLIGALLIHIAGWPAMFWINIPVLCFSFGYSWRWLPSHVPSSRPQLDYVGAISLAALLVLLSLSIPRIGSASLVEYSFPAAGVCAIAFIIWERHTKEPLINFSFFANRAFTTANLAVLFNNFLMYSTLLYMPIYLKTHRHTAFTSGVMLFIFSLSMSLTSWFGGAMTRSIGSRRIIALSFAINIVVVVWYVGLIHYSSFSFIVPGLLVAGVGSGLGTVAIQSTMLESVSRSQAGMASGIYSTFRYMGSITASSLLSIMVFSADWHWIILLIVTISGLVLVRGIPGSPIVEPPDFKSAL